MPTGGWRCTVRSTPTGSCSGSCNPVIDDAPDDFAVEEITVGIVDVVQAVAPGDHLVELQLAGLVEPGQPGDVGPRVARAEDGARQRLVHQDEVLQVDIDGPGQLRRHTREHAG